MVNPIFGVDVSGVQFMQEYAEGVLPTGTYRFIAPQLLARWQAMYSPYPVAALGSSDITGFNVGSRIDTSTFTFDVTSSGVAYLKDCINLGSASASGTFWSHAYIGRCYSATDAEVKYWKVSGARVDSVAVTPVDGAWRAVVTLLHKPPQITGADPADVTFTEYPGEAADPVLTPNAVGSGTIFTWNGAGWYLADLGFSINNNISPVPVLGEHNMSKFNRTVRDINVVVTPYEPNLETYIPMLNTVGTGVVTLATGKTATFTGLYLYGLTQLPFDPVRPSVVGLRGTARSVNLAG